MLFKTSQVRNLLKTLKHNDCVNINIPKIIEYSNVPNQYFGVIPFDYSSVPDKRYAY